MPSTKKSPKAEKPKVALVTGAGTGIGRAIVMRLAKQGYNVALNDIDLIRAQSASKDALKFGVRAVAIDGDVGEKMAVQRMVERALNEFGEIDALVNNAGIVRLGLLTDISEPDWRALFRVNVDGVFFCCQHVVPHMISRGQGAIVNVSSWNGKVGMPYFGAYCASKFAVIGLTQALAKEVSAQGIRVNAVCPGIISGTAMRSEVESLSPQFHLPPSAERAASIPLKRLGVPDDVAGVVAFLLSEEAGYMTGQAVNITGGLWMH